MKTVVGMFETRTEAEDAIRRLQAAGYANETIGVAMADRSEAAAMAESTGTGDLAAEGATAGALSGAGVGALIGLALVGSTIVLPGLGPILVGGSLATGSLVAGGSTAAALTGAGIGAASGGLIGGLVGAGIPEDDASDYAGRLEQGHILVSVQVPDGQEARARQVLVEEGARRV